MLSRNEILIFQMQPLPNLKYIDIWCCLSTSLVSRFFVMIYFMTMPKKHLFVCHKPLILRTQFYILLIISSIYYQFYKKFDRHGYLIIQDGCHRQTCQTKLIQFGFKIDPNFRFRDNKLNFPFSALQAFKQLTYSLLKNPRWPPLYQNRFQ